MKRATIQALMVNKGWLEIASIFFLFIIIDFNIIFTLTPYLLRASLQLEGFQLKKKYCYGSCFLGLVRHQCHVIRCICFSLKVDDLGREDMERTDPMSWKTSMMSYNIEASPIEIDFGNYPWAINNLLMIQWISARGPCLITKIQKYCHRTKQSVFESTPLDPKNTETSSPDFCPEMSNLRWTNTWLQQRSVCRLQIFSSEFVPEREFTKFIRITLAKRNRLSLFLVIDCSEVGFNFDTIKRSALFHSSNQTIN